MPSSSGATIMTPAATGTANRFVTNAMTGIVPNHNNTNGDTPSCAANVAAKIDEPRCGVISTNPAVAAADNTNPTDHVASGSIATMPMIVNASARNGATSRPIA